MGCETHQMLIKGVCLSTRLVSMQMNPSMVMLRTQTGPKREFFLVFFLTGFET